MKNGAATLHLLSKSELYFIIAEAKARLGQDASAELAEAVTASFEDYALSDGGMIGFDPSSAADYIASIGSASLAEIMVQKYIAQARDEQIQTYNDIRRCKALGQEFITLQIQITLREDKTNGRSDCPTATATWFPIPTYPRHLAAEMRPATIYSLKMYGFSVVLDNQPPMS